jgi:hypothetical protein
MRSVDHDSSATARAPKLRRSPRWTVSAGMWMLCLLMPLTYARGLAAADADAHGANPLAVLVEGPSFPARLAGFGDGEPAHVILEGGEGTRQIALDNLVRWGSYRDSDHGVQALLSDGSLLVGDFQSLNQDQLQLYSDLFGDVTLRLEQIRGLMIQPPADALKRDLLLDRIGSASRGSDRLLLDNGDELRGVISGPPSGVEQAQQPDDEALWLTMPERPPVAIPLARVAALIFNPTLIEPARSRERAVRVGLRDGSLLSVTTPSQAEGWVRLPLRCGLQLQCDVPSALEEITLLEPHSPRITYLSDMSPLGYKHIPFLDLGWEYRMDRSVLGGRLRSDGGVWFKGLGMHSTSRLAFDLDDEAQRFEAELALDDQAGRRGSVIYRVFVDRDGKWQAAYESPIVRGGQRPLPISVELNGARRLALIVEFADRGDELDHANWLNARLVRVAPLAGASQNP